MAEEVKCPNCEEKDRVTIAGRVFCINCGKPFDDGTHDDLPRPVAPAKPNATDFNVPSNSVSTSLPVKSTDAQKTNQRAVELQSLMNSEPKIIPTNNQKAQNKLVSSVIPVSPLEDFDQIADYSSDGSELTERVNSGRSRVSTNQVQSQFKATTPTQPGQSASAVTSSSLSGSTQLAPPSVPVTALPSTGAPTNISSQSISKSAVASSPSPIAVPVAIAQPSVDVTNVEPVDTLSAQPILAQSTLPLPTKVSAMPNQAPAVASQAVPTTPDPAPMVPIQPDSASSTTMPAVAQQPNPVPAPPLVQSAPSITSSPISALAIAPSPSVASAGAAIVPQPAQPNASINQPLPVPTAALPPVPSMPPVAQVLAANTTKIQAPTLSTLDVESPPVSAITNQVPAVRPASTISPIPTPPSTVDPINPAKSDQLKITKSPVSADKSSVVQSQSLPDGTDVVLDDDAPLDLEDKTIMSDDAFDKLLNTPSILSDNVKRVETTAQSNVISSSPPPFTPPIAPLTSADIKIVPSQAISDIRPVASATSDAEATQLAIPQTPVPLPHQSTPPVQSMPQLPSSAPLLANESVINGATQPRIVSDIKPIATQPNGATVLPAEGKLNIHPKHSFMAEPGVANRVSDSAAPDKAAQEQALKMALSSVGEQPAPQIGVSFKPANVALSLVVAGLLGFYIWQANYPNLAIKVAASKSGVTATIPGYLPSGWKIGKNINASDGMLSYDATNPSINKNIQIIQARTDWDSQALAENYVAPKYPGYTAFQVQGLIIYMYDDNKASWISNGNWFRIEGQTQALSQDQIIRMATSL